MSSVLRKYTDRLESNSDFWFEVARERFDDLRLRFRFGKNTAVPNGSWEIISDLSGPVTFLSAADTVRVKAGGDAADDSAGAGARTIRVFGIDDSLNFVSEDITLAGASASASTTTLFWRVCFTTVLQPVGTYGGSNTGNITLEDTSATTNLDIILAGEGSSSKACYTVPTGKTAYLIGWETHVSSSQAADVRLRSRADLTNTASPAPIRTDYQETGVLGNAINQPEGFLAKYPAGTDVWLEVNGSGGTTLATGAMEFLEVDDEDVTIKTVA